MERQKDKSGSEAHQSSASRSSTTRRRHQTRAASERVTTSHSASSSPRNAAATSAAAPPALKSSVSAGAANVRVPSSPSSSAFSSGRPDNMRFNSASSTTTAVAGSSALPSGAAGKPVLHPRGVNTHSLRFDYAGNLAPPVSDVPSTVKLLSELERSWAMFSASWKVVDLFAGLQIWQEQPQGDAVVSEQPNGVLLSTASAGLVTFVAGSIGGGGLIVAALLTLLVVAAALWTLSNARAKRPVPCFKTLQAVDGSPSEIFLYLMGVKNYPIWDASVEKAEVVHTIDDHSDIIHLVYRPVWIWPIWVAPRDVCLLRYWRRAEDGSYVICLQSALHPECPPLHGLVRATCKGGGFIISPRGQSISQSDELTSMVTNVVHLDPQGWEGKLLRRLNCMLVYLRPQVLALTGLHEVMEARKYVCPNVPEEFSAALAQSTEELSSSNAGQDGAGTAAGDDAAAQAAAAQALQDFPSNVPRAMWAEPDGSAVMVRGPDYLTDKRKIPSQAPGFRLVGVDLFESSSAVEHIAARPDNAVQRELKRHEEQGTEMPFTFVVNFVVPGNPRINMVLYYQAPNPSVLQDGSPFAELFADFLEGSDEFRNERFKLIPCIVEGSFIVRQAVGSTPALIGKKLRQPYFRGKQYFELDVDIGSSAVANRVVGLVSGYTKKLVIDMGFVLEGQSVDELPERLLGSVRLVHIDLGVAAKLD